MIDIIRAIQEESQTKLKDSQMRLDMRIGIHTGMVLSGLLGLRKWQYDIWSIDRLKASQMEHDGKPGHVHITRETLALIPSEERKKFKIKENHVLPNETTYLLCKWQSKISLKRKPRKSVDERHFDQQSNKFQHKSNKNIRVSEKK